jgi:hypothetical protein
MSKISVIIPAHQEPFLEHTIIDLNTKAEDPHNLEIIAVLDGYWPNPALPNYKNLIVIHETKRKGMRHSINSGARVASGKYLMKIDAHCCFAKGYDKKLMADCRSDYTVVPVRYSLDTIKWTRKVDKKYEFEYISYPDLKGRRWPEYAERVKGENVCDLMTTQGSCWFMHRAQFEKWGRLDEVNYGGMGREAQEVCLKTWLSGGRFVLTRNTWYAHWSKGKDDIKFYSRKDKQKSVDHAVDFWMNDKWPLATKKIRWLIEKFAPVPGWENSLKGPVPAPIELETRERLKGEPKMISPQPVKTEETAKVEEVAISERQIESTDGVERIEKVGMNRLELYKYFASLGFKTGAEIGVQRGRNAIVMVDNIPDLKLYLVDPYRDYEWSNRMYGEKHHNKFKGMTHKRMRGKNVVFLEDFSEDAVREVPDDSLDFVYIDGMHTYNFVMLDLILWSRKVRGGGIISGHDYIPNRNVVQVMWAVDDYVRRHKIKPLYLTDPKACVAAGDKSTSFFFVNPPKQKIVGRVMNCTGRRR